jgi:hypothetical protein
MDPLRRETSSYRVHGSIIPADRSRRP